MNKKIVVFGTRPEFIKLLPVIAEIKRQRLQEEFVFIFTGQHFELTEDLWRLFDFKPDATIDIKNHNNSLGFSFAYLLSGIQKIVDDIEKADKIKMIIGLGDTTSCACAAMCAFFNEIPFGHIEAGLRTYNLQSPYPEEYFRRIITLTSTIHFTPTCNAQQNLLNEGVNKEQIILTGNTIVDAVEIIKSRLSQPGKNTALNKLADSKNNILITCHRRENQNGNFHNLVDAVKLIAEENPSLNFVWLLHKTPFISAELTDDVFKNQPNVTLLPPLNVIELYALYANSKIIITDSGGMQEEAPSFNIPVIVIREKTERNESVDLSYSVLTGMSKESIIKSFYQLLNQPEIEMKNPYGDGKAAERIVNYLKCQI